MMYSGSRSCSAEEPGKNTRTFLARRSVLLKPEKSKVFTVASAAPFVTSISEIVPLGSLTRVGSSTSRAVVAVFSSAQIGSPSLATRIVFLSGVKLTWSGKLPTVRLFKT